jgi:alpha-L-fucosidase 2
MRARLVIALFLATSSFAIAELKRDVEYGVAGDERLLLDVNVPDEPGPHPIAILVHGGGWSSGDKSGSNKPGDGADISPWFGPLTEAHYTWFSINYRLAPKNRWPACIDDLRTAIRWVKAHAADYHGDAQRIALFGHSAGGHLVCLAGTQFADEVKVQAIVGFAPVTEFEQELPTRGGLSPSLQKLFDRPKEVTPDLLAQLRNTSPLTYVKKGLPPFLILQGDKDKTVPYQQTLNFMEKLHAAGVPCQLITIPGASHSLLAWDPLYPDYKAQLIAWLNRTLDAAPLTTANSFSVK